MRPSPRARVPREGRDMPACCRSEVSWVETGWRPSATDWPMRPRPSRRSERSTEDFCGVVSPDICSRPATRRPLRGGARVPRSREQPGRELGRLTPVVCGRSMTVSRCLGPGRAGLPSPGRRRTLRSGRAPWALREQPSSLQIGDRDLQATSASDLSPRHGPAFSARTAHGNPLLVVRVIMVKPW